ncbi:hypothetical protein [Oxynema aestuarii]|uniref:Uncharacterized protein n=1 Tax=Oxynema aestuarii AP17 TaxID=2064643 RepID=A0A6H1U0R5_9CYAN|nr:hypothetical protein [Oxynema aestuarii]QIZ71209.1 hypothetical protein HCG48_11985 [Oxynema aestuarii AP17]
MSNTNTTNQPYATLLDESLENVQSILTEFAKSQEFLAKIETAFGNDYDANGLAVIQQQWSNGDFASLPQIEILTGSQLSGANAAYAGENNTIYFSQDFLNKPRFQPRSRSPTTPKSIGATTAYGKAPTTKNQISVEGSVPCLPQPTAIGLQEDGIKGF